MNNKQIAHTSKFLSFVLRHQPQEIGIVLDEAGWASTQELLDRCNAHGTPLTLPELETIVETNEKKRFAFSGDRQRIRANQGHSVTVELGYPPTTPPNVLYHGTHKEAVDSIIAGGIHKGSRHHVHLTTQPSTAAVVGQRRGDAVVIAISAAEMHCDGHLFFESENHVWLTEYVPARYLRIEGKTP